MNKGDTISRLTLRLPETLHRQLESLAHNEAVSLNQYIVYALTRQATLAYTVQPVPEKTISQQQASYSALLQSMGQGTFSEIEKTLAARERVKPERGLNPDAVKALKSRLARQKATAGTTRTST